MLKSFFPYFHIGPGGGGGSPCIQFLPQVRGVNGVTSLAFMKNSAPQDKYICCSTYQVSFSYFTLETIDDNIFGSQFLLQFMVLHTQILKYGTKHFKHVSIINTKSKCRNHPNGSSQMMLPQRCQKIIRWKTKSSGMSMRMGALNSQDADH